MPSCSDALRDLIESWFPASDDPPYFGLDCYVHDFLTNHGWTEENGLFSPPTPSYKPGHEEVACLIYLRDEWDYDFRIPGFDNPYAHTWR